MNIIIFIFIIIIIIIIVIITSSLLSISCIKLRTLVVIRTFVIYKKKKKKNSSIFLLDRLLCYVFIKQFASLCQAENDYGYNHFFSSNYFMQTCKFDLWTMWFLENDLLHSYFRIPFFLQFGKLYNDYVNITILLWSTKSEDIEHWSIS
jgi:hypothetical protein